MQRRTTVLFGAAFGVCLALLAIALLGRATPGATLSTEKRALLPEAEGALRHVVLHWTPEADRDLARPYADFLRAIDPSVEVTFVLPRGLTAKNVSLFEARLAAIDPSFGLAKRATRLEVDGPITAWSKDRALVSGKDAVSGRSWLTIAAEPSDSWPERHNDWRTVSRIVERFPDRFHLDTSPFDFDAGDLAVGRGALIIDSNLLEKNRRRGFTSLPQLAGRLGEYLHMQVLTLGENWGDTPRHHLSMYMTPLTNNQVLVGDPRAAAAVVGPSWEPGESGVETGKALIADFSEATAARFDRAERDLASQGFAVTRIVNVPFDDKTYLSYTNGVFEVRAGRRLAYVPAYDVPELDHMAHATYRRLGWEVIPIHVRSLYPYHGTIGCVVNVLERR